ncbi:sigma-54-dependent Fis family transcriptional regulator [Bacteroides sp. 214]|uniref:sigma-54-dependent transcriptional regulator n=1 Tax=Bacteroides sp. 214 TaxID=2302935 RepID=UPI0013D344B7|nr:sigma-54 dependent transcriptional regulator [Bacteroides sp. 214]NDW13858.1 sigma-54-dependent Fis family transcriptional regulator [Bacteroides sp. 214]
MKRILIVEDDLTFALMLQTWLGKKGFMVATVSSVLHAKKNIEQEKPDLILSDLRLPDEDGISLLKWIKKQQLQTPFIMMTSYADIQTAVTAIKLGANDYIAKPVNPDELLRKINESFATSIKNEVKEKPEAQSYAFIEGESEAAKLLFKHVRLVAPTNMSVLIIGASGTGKEYVAHRIHELSKRKDKPFIPIDCGSIPKELAASEFFGHIKGAFTGALSDKTGAFIAANGGTIFLDEIGNLSYEIQIQLLRALQERRIRPIGSNQEVNVDIRLIAATNEDLKVAIQKGAFREDLYHRINEFTLDIPNLKERQEDIFQFANFFLQQANKELGKQLTGFDKQATQKIAAYHWPGNLRQLKNVIKRATLLAQGEQITVLDLDSEIIDNQFSGPTSLALYNEKTEKEQILEALRQANNNKSKAAQLLKIDRKTLYNKLKIHNLDL